MNIQLSNAEEYMDGKSTGSLGQVLIRYVAYGGTPASSSHGDNPVIWRPARRAAFMLGIFGHTLIFVTSAATTYSGFQQTALKRKIRR